MDISIEQVIGRISVCDRITRLAAVHDALAEIIAGLHKSAVDRSFDLIAATVRSIEQTLRNLESIDQTHDTLMSAYFPGSTLFGGDVPLTCNFRLDRPPDPRRRGRLAGISKSS